MKIFIPSSREEWLEKKQFLIGGSEISAIVGKNKFMTPRDVWMKKTGRDTNNEDSWALLLGRTFESAVVKLWEEVYDLKADETTADNIIYIHDDYDFIGGTADRLFTFPDGDKGVLEIKTTNSIFEYDSYPEYWRIQLMWYMGIMGIKRGAIAWFEFRTRELKSIEIEFDQQEFDFLVESAIEFWNKNVLQDIEPNTTNLSDVLKKFPTHRDGEVIEASDYVCELYSQIKELEEKVKPVSEIINSKKDEIKMLMKSAEAINYMGERLFSYKASSESESINKKKLQTEFPEVFEKVVERKPGSRRLLVK